MTERRWQRAPNWYGAEFEDSLVMVDVELGTYVGLNDTAAAVWEVIEHPTTSDDIVRYLRARFDVPADVCTAAVDAALERFCDAKLAIIF